MERQPLVSLIVPVYNVRPYLREALDSALAQTYRELEIILVDDGSTDGSGAVCDEYAGRDRRIRVIHQRNGGLSAARNAGLRAMTGEFVAFLDPDDALEPAFVREMVAAMAKTGADMVICRFSTRKTTGSLTGPARGRAYPSIKSGLYTGAEALQALAAGRITMSVWNRLYKRALWEDVRFPEGHIFEDSETSFQTMGRCARVFVLDRTLYRYRRRPGSLTSGMTRKRLEDRLRACDVVRAYIRQRVPAVFSEAEAGRYDRRCLVVMMNYYARIRRIPDIDHRAAEAALRARILTWAEEAGPSALGWRVGTGCRVMRACPGLFNAAYAVYHRVHRLIARVRRG